VATTIGAAQFGLIGPVAQQVTAAGLRLAIEREFPSFGGVEKGKPLVTVVK
jgi:hypothetical protein